MQQNIEERLFVNVSKRNDDAVMEMVGTGRSVFFIGIETSY